MLAPGSLLVSLELPNMKTSAYLAAALVFAVPSSAITKVPQVIAAISTPTICHYKAVCSRFFHAAPLKHAGEFKVVAK